MSECRDTVCCSAECVCVPIQLYCGDFSGKDPLSMWGHFSDHYYIKDILRFKFCLSWD